MGSLQVGMFFLSFWPTLPDLGCRTNEPIFWPKVLLKTRFLSDLLEPLISFLELILWTKNQKLVKKFTPTNAKVRRKAPRAIDGYNSLSEWARELFKPSKAEVMNMWPAKEFRAAREAFC